MYLIEVKASEGGTVNTIGGELEAGATLVIEAFADNGYEFTKWSNGSTANPQTIIVNENQEIVAEFSKLKYPLNITVVGEGQVLEEDLTTSKNYEYMSNLKLTAIPAQGWHFVSWSGDITSTESIIEVSIDKTKNITVTFEKNIYTLTTNIIGEGSISEKIINSGKDSNYEYNTTIELTANPSYGWAFLNWSGDIISEETVESINLTDNKEITATFIELKNLDINVSGYGTYSITIIEGEEISENNYLPNTILSISAIPINEGEKFVSWNGDITSSELQTTVTMDSNKSINLNFKDIMIYMPDDNFEEACAKCGLDEVINDSISLRRTIEIRSLYEIVNAGVYRNCKFNNMNIKDFRGIEAFKNIQSLDIGNNPEATSIDLSNFTKLTYFSSQKNIIETYDFSTNPNIEEVYIYHNFASPNYAYAKNVIFSDKSKLRKLSFTITSISSLNLSDAINLEYLVLRYNYGSINSLDVSKSPKLQFLNITNSNINCLNVSLDQYNLINSSNSTLNWVIDNNDYSILTTDGCN